MANRHESGAIDISDVNGLLKKGKRIRSKYKALKAICDIVKEGEAVDAADMRRLADELKQAIDEAHSEA